MRILLDTHVALWAITDSRRLSPKSREVVADSANDLFISAATLWEIAIKHALKRRGRNAMTISAQGARKYFEQAGYALLSVTPDHVCGVEALPRIHVDPFDRILVAQAAAEPMRLLTQDSKLAEYGAFVIPA